MSDPYDPTRRMPPPAPGGPQPPPPPPGGAPPPPAGPAVPPGEPVYTEPVAPAGTVDTDPVPPPEDSSRTVLYIIVGILVIAVGALSYLLLTEDDEVALAPTPTPTPTVVPTPTIEPTPEPEPAPTVVVTVTPTPTPAPTATAPAQPTVTDQPVPEIPATFDPTERPGDDPGTLTAEDGRSLFPVPEQDLASFIDQAVTGGAVLVESAVADVGFWVGTDQENRLFVTYTTEFPPPAEQPVAGQRVDLTGVVRPIDDPGRVPDGPDRERYQSQGVHIELSQLILE